MFKIDILNNKRVLHDMYINKIMSTTEISKLLGCTFPTILNALKHHNIPIRARWESKKLKQPKINIDKNIIDGGLLGDAWLRMYPKSINPVYSRSNIHYEHVFWNALFFYSDQEYVKRKIVPRKLNEKWKTIYSFTTLSHAELLPFYERWYPKHNNYKKYVPNDIDFTPELLTCWFFDDGWTTYSIYKGKDKIIKYPRGGLSTNGFTLSENEYLVHSINSRYGNITSIAKSHSGHGYHIQITSKNIKAFLDILETPMNCFKYKWKEKQVILC